MPGLCSPLNPPIAVAWCATQAPKSAPLPAATTGLAPTINTRRAPAARASLSFRVMDNLDVLVGVFARIDCGRET